MGIAAMSRADSPLKDRLIFAVGARRSGTNWLQRVLVAHPDVTAVPSETYIFSHGLQPLRERFHHGSLSSTQTGVMFADRDLLLDAMRDLCDAVFGDLLKAISPDATRLVERTPDHVRNLDLIGEVYPDAHVVHIVRDGRDVVRSLLSQAWGPDDVRLAALEWRSAIEAAATAGPKLANFHEIRYEELHADPARWIPQLYTALGLRVDAELIDQALTEAGVRYNVDPSAPHIATGKWQGNLTAGQLAVVDEVAGDLLYDLGYSQTAAARPADPKPERRGPRGVAALLRRTRRESPRIERQRLLASGQSTLNAFLEAALHDPSAIEAMVTEDVHVRVVTPVERRETRGGAAVRMLLDALRSDLSLQGRQEFGYIHPSLPAFTWVGSFSYEGRSHARVFTIDLTGGRISRIAYYSF